MLAKRIIPCLDVRAGRVVKGVNFDGIQDVEDPVALARYYNDNGADELVFYDITASYENRGIFTDILTRVAEALLLVETIDGQQFEALFTGEVDAEGLAEKVRVEGEAKKARDEEEAAEAERLRKEEEERLKEELEKYDTNYLADDEEAPLEELEINEKVNEDESNS